MKTENGLSWRIIATALVSAAWLVLFSMTAWTLSSVVQLKVDVGQIKEHLGMQTYESQSIEQKR